MKLRSHSAVMAEGEAVPVTYLCSFSWNFVSSAKCAWRNGILPKAPQYFFSIHAKLLIIALILIICNSHVTLSNVKVILTSIRGTSWGVKMTEKGQMTS